MTQEDIDFVCHIFHKYNHLRDRDLVWVVLPPIIKENRFLFESGAFDIKTLEQSHNGFKEVASVTDWDKFEEIVRVMEL